MRHFLLAIAVANVILGWNTTLPAAEETVNLGSVTERHEMIPMRDGTRLSAYCYLPPGDGPWPVLYEQRYANVSTRGTREGMARRAAAGYVVVAENFRGSHLSEGAWVGYRARGWGDLQDGYDTVEWLAAQSWSNGKIGTFGSSQAGFAQNFLAVTQPPHLVCQYMIDTGLSLFHEGYRIGGATKPERFKTMDAICREPLDNRRLMDEWFRHPTYDKYWAAEDCTLHFAKMDVPCFTVGSWYDYMCVGSVESYIGRQHRGGPHSCGQQKLLIGPWLHGGVKDNHAGELTYPANASFALEAHMLRWFDHYLRGLDNGVEREPTIRYYSMGPVDESDAPGNEWQTAEDWPVASTPTAFYLHSGKGHAASDPESGGLLDQQAPETPERPTTFLADPLHPNAIPGTAFPGARDAQAFEKQAEVRTFTTGPLTKATEWTGKVRAELFVSSTAKDTDFIVRVSDVYPDGRSTLIMDSIRRARYRNGFDREDLLTPGEVVKVAFEIGWLSQVFAAGHRIRITVASTGAPFYEPNPNTGEPLGIELPTNVVVAKNTVYHAPEQASRILASVRSE